MIIHMLHRQQGVIKPPEGVKARRVYLALREDIVNRVYEEHETLPGEHKLAEMFDVSRVTVRRALEALCSEGLTEKRPGSGTVVCQSGADNLPMTGDVSSLMPQLAEMGRNTTARLLSFGYGHPPDYVAAAMGIDESASVQIATRVRHADALPFSHLTTYVPEAIACNYSESDLATTPLFELLERSGGEIDHAYQSVSATLASPSVAEALDITVGSALLSLQRVVCNGKGEGVEFLSAHYRPDLFRLDMTLARVGDSNARHWEPVIASPVVSETKTNPKSYRCKSA